MALFERWFGRKTTPPAAIPPGQRVYAIGDIHGRDDLFERLLLLIESDSASRRAAKGQLILLGDMIDRGPDSPGVVRRAMQLAEDGATIVLKGNHEAAMLDALAGDREKFSLWRRFGGDASLASWGVSEQLIAEGCFEEVLAAANKAVPIAERAWLERTRQWFQIGDYYFVHAGVRPGVRLDRQTAEDNLWIREEFLTSTRHHGAVIVHGHSVSAAVEDLGNRIGIDTGAYTSGQLTALGLEGTDRWIIQT
jgi:serine/threonine protein phosphatase 1